MASKHTKDQDYELKLVQALCWSRSFETETILIHVNPGGDRKEGGFMGGSGIWAPLKGKIGGYEREEVGVEFVDVELGLLKVRPLQENTRLQAELMRQDGRDLYKIRDDADRRSGDART